MNLYCCLNEKNFILNILKYMKYEYNENIYYELLSILFKKIYDKPKKNHLEFLNKIIFSLYSTVYETKNVFYENFYAHGGPGGQGTPPENIFNVNIINDMKKYSAKEAISSFVGFLKGLYENIKLYNFYDESITIKNIINLLFNLLKINQDENLTIQYMIFFNEYYNLQFLKNLGIKYTNNFTNINPLTSYLDNLYLITNEKYIFNHIYNISQILSDIKIQQNLSNINLSINSNNRKRSTLNYMKDFLSDNNSKNHQYIIFI